MTAGLSPTAMAGTAISRTAQLRTFWALCLRDGWVTLVRQPLPFLAQSLLQPIFFLFIFGRVLPSIGATAPGYTSVLFPGVLALTIFLTALQSVALPLVIEFSFTKEIEDRLLAPIATWAVAVEKLVFAAARALFAGAILFPLAILILPDFSLDGTDWPVTILVMIVGAIAAATIGLAMGTIVPFNQISLAFAIILTPLMMTGATFYPWATLTSLPWFQAISLLNPLTYCSEGLRAALTPAVPHMEPWLVLLGLAVSIGIFGFVGIRSFLRRAID